MNSPYLSLVEDHAYRSEFSRTSSGTGYYVVKSIKKFVDMKPFVVYSAIIAIVVVVALGLIMYIPLLLREPPYFVATASQSNFSIIRPQSKEVQITISSVNGFESEVGLRVLRAPAGLDIELEKNSVFVKRDENISLFLTLDLKEEGPSGTHYVDIGIEGTQVDYTINFKVNIISGRDETVRVEDYQYTPWELHIVRGNLVTWKFFDTAGHDVVADNGLFESSLLSQGESWSYEFTESGVYSYSCRPHPFMNGVVIVHDP